MARRTSITTSLDGAPEAEAPAPAPASRKGRGGRISKAAGQDGSPTDEARVVPDVEPQPTKRAVPPAVLAVSTGEAKRVGLYLHPDDFRALGLAKLDDGADANARIRAMLALWRSNPRFRSQVDRLARTAPRGTR